MSKIPETVGKYTAQVQDIIDRCLEWRFKKASESSQEPEAKQDENLIIGTGKKALKATLSVLGRMGTSYYHEYQRLKKKDLQTDIPVDQRPHEDVRDDKN